MNPNLDPLAVDRQFFTSLIEADFQALDRLLARDFMLIDVMSGSEITKSSLLAAMGSGQVTFEAIEPAENLVRRYQRTAVVTGRTQMKGLLGVTPFSVSSRYTHVYVVQQDAWRLVAAQGTKMLPAPQQSVL